MIGCQFRVRLGNYLVQVSKVVLGIQGGHLCAMTYQTSHVTSADFALKVELKWFKLAQNRQALRQLIATVCT